MVQTPLLPGGLLSVVSEVTSETWVVPPSQVRMVLLVANFNQYHFCLSRSVSVRMTKTIQFQCLNFEKNNSGSFTRN